MDISKFKKIIAGVSVSAMMLTQAGGVLAYTDVPSNAWFADEVSDFVAEGFLDGSQAQFRGGDPALRAEFVKLVVELNGGIYGTAPSTPSFNDVPASAWYFDYMEEAAVEGWVKGDGNCYGSSPCNARPGARINRAEASALINRAFDLVGTDDAPQFVDNPSGQWYTGDVQTAADNCILQGDDGRGTVRPGDNMNRAEMVVMLHRVDEGAMYPDCGEGGSTGGAGVDGVSATGGNTVEIEFSSSVDRGAAENLSNYDVDGLTVDDASLTGSDTVELTFEESMVPGETYTVYVNGTTTGGEDFEDSASFRGFADIEPSDGTIEVSLNPNTPLGDTVPKGAMGVAMLSADFTASCSDDVLIDGLTLIHEGQGVQSDIISSWMSVNGARVSRTRVFDSEDQTADIRFSRPLLIEACQTVTVDFMADFLSTAGTNGRHNYVIELKSDILSNAQDVTGTFPIRGETFEVAAVSSGIITTTYRSVTPSNVDVNDEDAVVGKWEFSINSTEDQTFYSVTLENAGTASDGDFMNIYVRRTDETPLTDVVSQTVADYVTLTFDPPFTVLEGDKITLEAVSDIVDGAADTIKMQFEEVNDVFGVGSLYGYGVNGQLYGSQITIASTPAVSTVTINAGELTVDIDGPVTEEYTPDADDVVMANVDFVTGGEDVNVNELYTLIHGQTSTGATLACRGAGNNTMAENIEDVEIRNTVTGQTVDGVVVSTGTASPTCAADDATNGGGTTGVYRFDDFVLRDSSRWELRMDFIADVPENGDKFRAYLCTADEDDATGCNFGGYATAATQYNFDAEGLSTGDKVTDIRPGEDVSGNFMEVASAELSVTERSLGTSDTVVENSQDVTLMRFEATAGKAEDIFLTQIVLKADAGDLKDGQDYTLWADSDDDGTVDTILQSGQSEESSQITFDEIAGGGYTVPAEETVMFEVHADIAGSLTDTTLSVGFDDNDGTQTTFSFVEGEEADDGTSLGCIKVNTTVSSTSGCSSANVQMTVNSTTSKVFTLKSQGTLFVTKDSTPTRSRQLLAGELGEAILRLELSAEDEPVDVTRMIFTNSGSIEMGITNTGATATESINRLKLYRDGESTPFASATKDNCNNISSDLVGNAFCAVMESQQLVVPEGDRLDILVRPQMKGDEEGAVQSNTGSISLIVLPVTISAGSGTANQTTQTGSITARGFESSNVLLATDGDTVRDGEVVIGSSTPTTDSTIVGNRNDVVLAKIVSIEDVNTAADGSQVPVGSNKTIAEFKLTAATNVNTLNGRNKVTLSGITFNVDATNVSFTASNFDLFNKNDQNQEISCDMYDSGNAKSTGVGSGSMLIDCKRANNTNVDLEMDSGDSITLVLHADIVNNQLNGSAGSSLQVSLNDFGTWRTSQVYGAASAANSHVQWSDSLGDATVTLFDWIEYDQTEISSTSYRI